MPANLTPEFKAAEEKLRAARTPKEKLEALQEMLRTIPKHKGTDHMQADIKRRIAQIKRESGKKSVKAVHSLFVKPEGIGQVFIVGPPNSGKSLLLDRLTNAKPEVAAYPFSTTMYQPGMMRYEDVWIQLVDMPPISARAPLPWIPSVVRYGNGALFVLSLASDDILSEAEEVLETLKKSKVILVGRGQPTGIFDNGTAALRTVVVATHCRDQHAEERLELLRELLHDAFDVVQVDMVADPGSVEQIRHITYSMLGLVRVYGKQPGKPPDLEEPFVLKKGSTLEDLAGKIHKDLKARLSYARIWSNDERKLDGQRVARNYVLQERDVVEIHT